MSDSKRYDFGTVIRVDPEINSKVPQPDARRWMVISFDDRHKWTTFYLGPMEWTGSMPAFAHLAHWSSLHGFVRVEDES